MDMPDPPEMGAPPPAHRTVVLSDEYPGAYREYFRHFDRGEDFECHEVLERLWLRDKNRFYQALIQLAVALYHLSRGNTEGGRKLLAAAEEKLREYPPGHMDMD